MRISTTHRAVIQRDGYGRVSYTLPKTHPLAHPLASKPETRNFTCRALRGGYVWEETDDGRRRQVFGHLSWSGSALVASADTLLEVIRREHHAAMRDGR